LEGDQAKLATIWIFPLFTFYVMPDGDSMPKLAVDALKAALRDYLAFNKGTLAPQLPEALSRKFTLKHTRRRPFSLILKA
jgi:hypothetical protein